MMKVEELIVVEGKNDINKLKEIINADIIETHGTHLSKKTIEFIKAVKERRGVIIFTDPDTPGDKIRDTINTEIAGCKNAFLAQNVARKNNKIGIEHANKEDLIEALENLVSYQERKETLSYQEYLAFGLNGQQNSKSVRKKVAHHFKIGEANAKTLFKRLNYLGVSRRDIEGLL